MSTDPRIERLRSLDTEATPGPWDQGYEDELVVNGWEPEDAALIAAMRNAWPAMVELLALVLGHHHATAGYGDCAMCRVPYPCQEAWHALAVLDTLDPPYCQVCGTSNDYRNTR